MRCVDYLLHQFNDLWKQITSASDQTMNHEKLRQNVALLAARLMYEREEKEYFTAKRKAAAQLGVNYKYQPKDLPSNREIREQILLLARLNEGDDRDQKIEAMRLAALRIMRMLEEFHPRLIGSVLTGHVRHGSDIDIHVFCDDEINIAKALTRFDIPHDVETKRVVKFNEERIFTHFHFSFCNYEFELTLYEHDKLHYGFKSSITGRSIEKASIAQLETLLLKCNPDLDLQQIANEPFKDDDDLFSYFYELMMQLDKVQQSTKYHPEGDALFHSLQVFELARERRPTDAEFLLAALLHDVGKGIDSRAHVEAGLDALQDCLSERTEFLIAHHMDILDWQKGKLPREQKRELKASPWFEDLQQLRRLDDLGRDPGARTCSLETALNWIANLME